MTSLERSSSRGGASRKIATGHKPDQSVAGKEKEHSGKARDGPGHGCKSAKGSREGVRIKALQYGYNKGKNQSKISNFLMYFAFESKLR